MSFTDSPLIAINALKIHEPRPGLRLDERYATAVLQAGGIPLAIPPVGGAEEIERLLERVDGLLLTGGDDFDTERLGLGPTHPQAVPVPTEKQDFDVELARRALDRGLPTLGICYGMQLLGLVDGGRLLQHLPQDRPGCQEHRAGVGHPVHPVAQTKLARLLGVEPIDVVSRHHQAMDCVKEPWTVSARDGQGLIEAIEREDLPFAIGVQWHPELGHPELGHPELGRPEHNWTPPRPNSRCSTELGRHGALFEGFVQAARAYAATRLLPN